jgi:hypothetical protein
VFQTRQLLHRPRVRFILMLIVILAFLFASLPLSGRPSAPTSIRQVFPGSCWNGKKSFGKVVHLCVLVCFSVISGLPRQPCLFWLLTFFKDQGIAGDSHSEFHTPHLYHLSLFCHVPGEHNRCFLEMEADPALRQILCHTTIQFPLHL